MNKLFRGMTFVVLITITLGCQPDHQVEIPKNPAPPPDKPLEIEESSHEATTFPLMKGKTAESQPNAK